MFVENPESYGIFVGMFCAYLGVDTPEEIIEYCTTDDGDEVWTLPPQFIVVGEVDKASTADFAIGKLWFGVMDAKPCIAEQNASPIVFYVAK
jgi:hypothetical protein